MGASFAFLMESNLLADMFLQADYTPQRIDKKVAKLSMSQEISYLITIFSITFHMVPAFFHMLLGSTFLI